MACVLGRGQYPKPYTLNPVFGRGANPKPQTLNPKLRPKPQTRSDEHISTVRKMVPEGTARCWGDHISQTMTSKDDVEVSRVQTLGFRVQGFEVLPW